MDEPTINNNNQNDDDNYSFHRAEKILFELANADGLLIMCKLRDQKMNNLSKLAKELGLVVQDVHRNVNRLIEAGITQRDSTGYFSLTTFGDTMLSELSTINFLATNRDYFLEHTFSGISTKFIQRIGSLSNSQYIDNSVAMFEYQRQIISEAKVYVNTVLPQVPLYLFDFVTPILTNDVKLSYMLPHNAIVSKKRHNERKHDAFYNFIRRGIVQRKMIEKCHMAIIMNEKYAMVMFQSIKGGIDMNSGFNSQHTIFHEWCFDYFDHMWQQAKHFDSKRLQEV